MAARSVFRSFSRSGLRTPFSSRYSGTFRCQKAPAEMKASECEDLFRYTSGRWLWAEEARLLERYKKFNIAGLQRLAAQAIGAQSCVSISKLAEGGFNKVFRLAMDNGSVVMARIPNPNIGSVSKVMASEVATMDFVRNVIGIPVPKVLAWDGGRTNIAECEYILMEQAQGTQLEGLWNDMDLEDKLKVVDDVIAIQHKLQSITFSRYGNIYFKQDAFEGCSKFNVSGTRSSSARMYAEDRFVIGPAVEKAFWDTEQSSPFDNRGPWLDAQNYLRAISQRERSRTPLTAPARTTTSETGPDVLNSPMARLLLLDKFDAVSPHLPPRDPSLDRPTLSHWDLRASNMFVEDGRIVSLIDWQDSWVGPLFTQERRPKLIEYHGDVMLRLPDTYETMKDEEEKARLADKVEGSILHWYYEREIAAKYPALQKLIELPLVRTRRETVLFASEVWDGETIPLRECLWQLQRNWERLDSGIACPISFASQEIEAHERASADWNEKADFWASLDGFVSRDGYTSIENYEAARTMFEELREQGLTQLSGAELTEFAEQSQWAKRAE